MMQIGWHMGVGAADIRTLRPEGLPWPSSSVA